jgi:hypothetical protein
MDRNYRAGLELPALSGLSILHAAGIAAGWLRLWSRMSPNPFALFLLRILLAAAFLLLLSVLAVLTTNPFYGSVWKGWSLLVAAGVCTLWAVAPLRVYIARGRV